MPCSVNSTNYLQLKLITSMTIFENKSSFLIIGKSGVSFQIGKIVFDFEYDGIHLDYEKSHNAKLKRTTHFLWLAFLFITIDINHKR